MSYKSQPIKAAAPNSHEARSKDGNGAVYIRGFEASGFSFGDSFSSTNFRG